MSKDYEGSKDALNKFIFDFSEHPDLPEALYWIAERYERFDRFEDANRLYQQILQNYPESSWVSKAKIGVSSANVKRLIISGNYDLAKEALNKLNAAFQGSPDFPKVLYWIAEKYREFGKYEEVRKIHKEIMDNFPDSPYADATTLDVIEPNIMSKAEDINDAMSLVNNYIADHNHNPSSINFIHQAADECYKKARELKNQYKQGQAMSYFAMAENIWKKIIDNYQGNLDKMFFYAAVCRYEQGNLEGASEYFQKVVSNYPNSEYTYSAQKWIGLCYETLQDSNQVHKEEINPLIEKTYKELLDKYPNNPRNGEILIKLGWLAFEKGNLEEAISYFEQGLEKYPENNRPINALYALGRIYDNNGEKSKAITTYKELLCSLNKRTSMADVIKSRIALLENSWQVELLKGENR